MTPFRQVWGMPILVTVVSSIALVTGLVADGLADVVAWVGAGVLPIGLAAWHFGRALSQRRGRSSAPSTEQDRA